MKIPSGSRVGLCAHLPVNTAGVDGMVLEVTTDTGSIFVLVCTRCWVRYTIDDEDLETIVTRQIVVGRGGWDLVMEEEVPS